MCWYLREFKSLHGAVKSGDDMAMEKLGKIRQKMVNSCATLRTLRVRAGYTLKARLSAPFDERTYEYDKEEWVSCKLRSQGKIQSPIYHSRNLPLNRPNPTANYRDQ